ncbi:MAG: helix-turn-helix domain-containing protein [Tissierellia bacterium]|nr:helix-turn-helix domain-containing protein [Tissierellia bacterium]
MNKQFSTFSVIPTEVMINKEISSTAKILYGIISSLTNEKGYCWASNDYLGELLGKTARQISSTINTLLKERLINSEIQANFRRKITLTNSIGRKKTSRGVEENCVGVGRKLPHNNIIEQDNNNIIIADANKKNIKSLYEKMGLPLKVRVVTQWQDEASNAVNYFIDGEEKRSSIFKTFKDNQHKARIAFSDCKELGKKSALYFLKVYNELRKK